MSVVEAVLLGVVVQRPASWMTESAMRRRIVWKLCGSWRHKCDLCYKSEVSRILITIILGCNKVSCRSGKDECLRDRVYQL